MNRIKNVFWIIHVVLWIFFTLLVGFQLAQGDNANWFTITSGFVLTNMCVFYGHFYFLTSYLAKKKTGKYLIRVAAVSFASPIIFVLSHYAKSNFEDIFIEYYGMALVTAVPIFLLLSWLARVTENLVINTFKKEQLEKHAIEAELNYLKSQINPHFLFNTLHNIHTLVYKKAPTAPEAVLRLASLMRYMIYESNTLLVPLAREIDYLKDYISLQQLRYKKSPVVQLNITGSTDLYQVAPLLFIDLIENAYKHSSARLEPGDINLRLEIKEDMLVFEVKNPALNSPARDLAAPRGIGLMNLKKRLALLYPNKHTLDMVTVEGTFKVKLTIIGLKLPAHEQKTDLLYYR